jgi:hypothetical protein
MTHPIINNLYAVANGTTSTSPFVEVFLPRDPTPNDVNYQIQQRWWNTALNTEFMLVGFSTVTGNLQAIWAQIISGASTVDTVTGDDGLPVTPVLNNLFVKGLPPGEPDGGILFYKSALTLGQLNAQVQVDNVTIGINGANQLTYLGPVFVPFVWQGISVNTILAKNNGYICQAPGGVLLLTLPALSSVGDNIKIMVNGALGFHIVQPNVTSQIILGAQTSTLGAGGSIISGTNGDTISLICVTPNSQWEAEFFIGNYTVI